MFANLCSYLALSTACIVLPAVAAEAKDNIPVNPKLLVKPPAEAIVLFDGKPGRCANWYARRSKDPAGWTVDAAGVATPNHRDISSRQEFGDCYLHVEFDDR